jgi:hypothetical protein
MSGWTAEELDRIGDALEMQLAPVRRDGTVGGSVTIWVVRDADKLYVRSSYGTEGHWYKRTRARHAAHISAGGVEKDVQLVDARPDVSLRVDAAYRSKYGKQPAQVFDPMVGIPARDTTMQLVPR